MPNSLKYSFWRIHLWVVFAVLPGWVLGQCPSLDFVWSTQSYCSPTSIIFTPSALPPSATVSWSVNGIPSGNNPLFIYTFATPGTYTITMQAVQANGSPCQSIAKSVDVLGSPTPAFSVNPPLSATYCSGVLDATFSATAQTGVTQAVWLIDNQNYSGTSVTHTFTSPGQKLVSLQVIDTNGCTGVIQDTIYVNLVDTVSGFYQFRPQDEKGCITHRVRVGGTVNIPQGYTLDSLIWDFPGSGVNRVKQVGPITNSTLVNRSFTFTQQGRYYFRLRAFSNGCSYQIPGNFDTIIVDRLPSLSAIPEDDTVCVDQWIRVFNTSTNKAGVYGNFEWRVPGGLIAGNSTDSILRVRFRNPGIYDVQLAYRGGCEDSIVLQQAITVPGPKAILDPQNTNRLACAPPHTVTFYDNSILPQVGQNLYQWTFYDTLGNVIGTDTAKVPSFTYTYGGSFRVELTITNTVTGCSHTAIANRFVVIGNPMALLATQGPPIQCSPATFNMQPFNLTDHIDGYRYRWEILDGNGNQVAAYNNQYPNISISKPGSYGVRFIVSNGPGCVDTLMVNNYLEVSGIQAVVQAPVSGACLQNGPFSHTFQLDSISVYPPAPSFPNWNFQWSVTPSNGVLMSSPFNSTCPTTFTEPGCFVATVQLTTQTGCTYTFVSDTFCVGVKAESILPLRDICVGSSVQILDTSVVNADSSSTFVWSTIPAGGTFSPSATAKDPVISFNAAGNYSIVQQITNGNGCSDTAMTSVNVYSFTSSLSVSDTFVNCGPAPILFRSTAPHAVEYDWTINGFGLNNVHVKTKAPTDSVTFFIVSGGYTVSCVARTEDGCTDSTWTRVSVGGPLPRYFAVSPNKGCTPLTVAFQDTSSNIDSLIFDFGDGSPIQTLGTYPMGSPFQHTFVFPPNSTADSVVYEPTLYTLSVSCPNPIVLKQRIVVYPPPDIAFQAPVRTGCQPFDFTFLDQSIHADTPSTFVLDYGDGTVDSIFHPTFNHTFQGAGTFDLHYRVYSPFGCVADTFLTQFVTVDPSPIAGFVVLDDSLCFEGNTFQFQDTSLLNGTNSILSWNWTFGDTTAGFPSSNLQNPQFSASSPGTYWVSLKVTSDNGCSDSLFIPNALFVWDTLPPVNAGLDVISVSGNNLHVQWTPNQGPKFESFVLERDNGTGFVPVLTSQDPTLSGFVDQNVNVNSGPYDYRLIVTDLCGTVTEPSIRHSSVFLTGNSPSLGSIQLNWTPYGGWPSVDRYDVYYQVKGGSVWVLGGTVLGMDTTFTFAGLCDTIYAFEIHAIHPSGASLISRSNIIRLRPQYDFPISAPELFQVSVVDDRDIDLNWEPTSWPNFRTYIIDRKVNDGFWDLGYVQTTQTGFRDLSVDVDLNAYTYRLRMEDNCGKSTDTSNLGRSILLKVISDNELGMVLIWEPYVEWSDGVQKYQIHRSIGDTNFRLLTEVGPFDTIYEDVEVPNEGRGQVCYYLVAKRNNGIHSSKSNEACSYFPRRLYIPNSFSPNDDGVNDRFEIVGLSFEQFDMVIQDRWGRIVFETTDPRIAWDGRDMSGTELPIGVYVFHLKAKGFDGHKVFENGRITLIR
ncbi:MAG: PKD domain-containing protein [Bacteroidota bacterium]|nr:PKD domain-containing protein [Bacteroidota bacterium]